MSASSLSLDSKMRKSLDDVASPAVGNHDGEEKAVMAGGTTDPMSRQQDTDPFLVRWEENDPDDPFNWSNGRKSWITFQLGMLALAASLASSIISPAQGAIVAYTGVSEEVAVLDISLYILGFIFGPCVWAPVSEIWGRKWSMLPAMVGLGIFSIGTAVSRDATGIFVTRFFGGFFGSAPVSNVSAALGDIWRPKARGTAVTFYAVAVVGGPTLGPVIGSALTASKGLGWRWTE
jgi:predicted MFS family arabinose efflux permease